MEFFTVKLSFCGLQEYTYENTYENTYKKLKNEGMKDTQRRMQMYLKGSGPVY